MAYNDRFVIQKAGITFCIECKMKKYEVVGEGTHCKDNEYIQCSVINQWDWKTKCTAIGDIGKETLKYHFVKYKTENFKSYMATEIENPKDYPEIVDYCRRNNIEILN